MYKDRDVNQRDSRFENQQDGFKKKFKFQIF